MINLLIWVMLWGALLIALIPGAWELKVIVTVILLVFSFLLIYKDNKYK